MCIGMFSFKHPGYALILASNRDEYLARATDPTTFHSFGVKGIEDDLVLSGVDLQAGGSWLGINKYGEVAMLTNITSTTVATGVLSRGDLVKNFLTRPRTQSMDDFVQSYAGSGLEYGGFNLLLLSPSHSEIGSQQASLSKGTSPSLYRSALLSNNGARGQIVSALSLSQDERVGAISNASGLGTSCPDWPKVKQGKHFLEEILESTEEGNESHAQDDEEVLIEKLFGMMSWRSPEKIERKEDLSLTIQVRPIDNAGGIYGTRLSTVLLVREDGSVRWVEKDIFQLREGIAVEGTDQREFAFKTKS